MDRAVAAIARQDVANIEIVVIHDRADEMSIRRRVETEIGRLPCTFVPAARLGPGGLRNLGVRSNSAPYFAIIDGSEELDPSYLGLARDALDATPGAGFAAAPVRHSLAAPLDSRVSSSTDLPRILASPWSIAGAALMRRASFDRVGGFDESLPDLVEWDYLLTLGEHGEHGVLLPRPFLPDTPETTFGCGNRFAPNDIYQPFVASSPGIDRASRGTPPVFSRTVSKLPRLSGRRSVRSSSDAIGCAPSSRARCPSSAVCNQSLERIIALFLNGAISNARHRSAGTGGWTAVLQSIGTTSTHSSHGTPPTFTERSWRCSIRI